MNLQDDTHLFDRIGKKRRKRLMMSAELAAVLDSAVGPGQVSRYVEAAVWSQLVHDYGRQEVQNAIAEAQADLDSDDQLDDSKPYTLTV